MRRQFLVILVLAALFPAVYHLYLERSQRDLTDCWQRLHSWSKRVWFYEMGSRQLPARLEDVSPSGIPDRGCGDGIDYQFSADGSRWTLSCKGSHHVQLGIRPNCPQYSSEEGLLHYQPVP